MIDYVIGFFFTFCFCMDSTICDRAEHLEDKIAQPHYTHRLRQQVYLHTCMKQKCYAITIFGKNVPITETYTELFFWKPKLVKSIEITKI